MTIKNQSIIKKIHDLAGEISRDVKLMELCGTHAQAVAQHGIKELMPKNVRLISGPGCPVCVAHQDDIDIIVGLALAGIPIAVYGDFLALPGSQMNLNEAREQGADVSVVYSSVDALKLQKEKPNLVFIGVGFDTTTPMSAWAVKKGLTVFSIHKLFLPALGALLANKNLQIDGFINPGHVSAIVGSEVYRQFKVPQVIAGFEAHDVIVAINMLLRQIKNGQSMVENEYTRVVKPAGNKKAWQLIHEVFQVADASWRGLGVIPGSGLKIKAKYKSCDAAHMHAKLIKDILKTRKVKPNKCICGLILQGLKEPKDCVLFGRACVPGKPEGACMVSVEGSCNVEYRFRRG